MRFPSSLWCGRSSPLDPFGLTLRSWVALVIPPGLVTEVGGSTESMETTRMGNVTDKCMANPSIPVEAYTVTRMAWSTARNLERATDRASDWENGVALGESDADTRILTYRHKDTVSERRLLIRLDPTPPTPGAGGSSWCGVGHHEPTL